MRMWDITFLIICFELAMGLASGVGLFAQVYYMPIQQTAGSSGSFLAGNVSDTGELIDSSKARSGDDFTSGVSMIWSGVGLFLNIAGSVACFYPHLVKTFMFPSALAVIVQTLIYICYSWSIAQFLSGRYGLSIQ